MRETLEDIRSKIRSQAYRNAAQVRGALVTRVLHALGWDIWDPREVCAGFMSASCDEQSCADFALLLSGGVPAAYVIVETQAGPRVDLRRPEVRLEHCNRGRTVDLSVITDGRTWRLYYSRAEEGIPSQCFRTFDMADDGLDGVESALVSFLSKDQTVGGHAREAAERSWRASRRGTAMEEVMSRARKAVFEPPYPSLPAAVVHLVSAMGVSVSEAEAAEFIQELRRRAPAPEPPGPSVRHMASWAGATRPAAPGPLPVTLAKILEVVEETDRQHLDYSEAAEAVARRRRIDVTTVRDACTRKLGLDTTGFRDLLDDRDRLAAHLSKHFPDFLDQVRERVAARRE